MNQQSPAYKLGRYTQFILTGSNFKKVVLFGGAFWIITSLLGISGYLSARTSHADHSIPTGAIIVLLSISLIAAIAFGSAMARSSEIQRKRLGTILGIQLTPQDQVALALWQQHGIKPQHAHLQPVLAAYVTYLEETLTGRTSTVSQKSRILFFVIGCYNFISHLVMAVQHSHGRWLNAFMAGASVFLILLFFPQRAGHPNLLMSTLSRRQLRKVARMRAQLIPRQEFV